MSGDDYWNGRDPGWNGRVVTLKTTSPYASPNPYLGLRYAQTYVDESAKVPAFSIDGLAAKMARSSPRYSLADMEEALTKASAMAAVCEFFGIVRMAESIPMRAPVNSLPGLMVENGSMLNRWGRS